MKATNSLNRRHFIRNLGLVSGALVLGCDLESERRFENTLTETGDFKPNLFVQLRPDGNLLLTASRSEMGQGVRTSLTAVIADEMDADWELVTVVQAPGDDAYGNQNTDGSRSIRTLYEPMRKMGAMAREMLIAAAASRWQVQKETCYSEKHFVINSSSKERLFYGDLVTEAAAQSLPEEPRLKKRSDFNYIGKELPGVDVDDITSGKSIYGMDVKLPMMKYACLARSPVTFGEVVSYDSSRTEKIEGVEQVMLLERTEKPFGNLGSVAVIAQDSWSAIEGKKALRIEWDDGANQFYDTKEYMISLVDNVTRPGKLIEKSGNVDEAFDKAEMVVEAVYSLPHLVHTPMETPNATAYYKAGECEIWAPVQAPQVTRKEVSDLLDIPLDKVTVNVTLLGGGFGRKAKPDFVLEAAMLSKKTGFPVQVIWTREDDIRHSYYHAISAQYLKAGLDDEKRVNAWLHRSAYPSITSTFLPGSKYGAGFEFQQGMTNMPYEIENIRFENGEAPAHVRIGWFRSVYNVIHGFSINVFVDELAAEAKEDPFDFRMKLIGSDRVYPSDNQYPLDTVRLKAVLNRAASKAGWGKPLPEGHGMGIAVHYSFYTYVAAVIEVSMANGRLKVERVVTAVDCGTVVNRNTVRAQMEGAAIFGLSLAFYGDVSTKSGRVEQSNFHDYQVLRMHETPVIEVEIMESEALPTGIGEPGVPVIAPALLNAIYNASGTRYRSLPLKKHGLV